MSVPAGSSEFGRLVIQWLRSEMVRALSVSKPTWNALGRGQGSSFGVVLSSALLRGKGVCKTRAECWGKELLLLCNGCVCETIMEWKQQQLVNETNRPLRLAVVGPQVLGNTTKKTYRSSHGVACRIGKVEEVNLLRRRARVEFVCWRLLQVRHVNLETNKTRIEGIAVLGIRVTGGPKHGVPTGEFWEELRRRVDG